MEPISMGVMAAGLLAGTGTLSWAALKGWQGWRGPHRPAGSQGCAERTVPPATGRIEMADLRERVRKLEAIAAGIDI